MKRFLFTLSLGALPFSAFAQRPNFEYIGSGVTQLGNIVNIVIPVLIAIAVIYFIWQVIRFVIATDEEGKKEAKSKIVYGVIGLFVIVTIWGLVFLLGSILGINRGQNLNSGDIPTVPVR